LRDGSLDWDQEDRKYVVRYDLKVRFPTTPTSG
jgi:hypothetical protein